MLAVGVAVLRPDAPLPGVVEVLGVLGVPGTSISSPSISSDQDTVRWGGSAIFLGTTAWWSPLVVAAEVPFMVLLVLCLRREGVLCRLLAAAAAGSLTVRSGGAPGTD